MRKATFHFDSNIHYNPSCPKLPASWQSKLSFRRSSIPYTVLGTVLWWPIFKHCSKKAYHFQEQCILKPFVANQSITQSYLLCLSGQPAWSACPEEQISLSCACWISSCLCHLPLPLLHSSAAASPWQQPHPAAWLIMQNKTVTPKYSPPFLSIDTYWIQPATPVPGADCNTGDCNCAQNYPSPCGTQMPHRTQWGSTGHKHTRVCTVPLVKRHERHWGLFLFIYVKHLFFKPPMTSCVIHIYNT